MDACDRGQAAAETFLRAALADRKARCAAGGESATHCRECGEPIPEKRQEAMPGCTLCVACRQKAESRCL